MASAVARVGDVVAGIGINGIITSTPSCNVYANNKAMATIGQLIAPHLPCGDPDPLIGPPHCAAIMVESSTTVYANNRGVCRKGDMASCLDIVVKASSTVYAG